MYKIFNIFNDILIENQIKDIKNKIKEKYGIELALIIYGLDPTKNKVFIPWLYKTFSNNFDEIDINNLKDYETKNKLQQYSKMLNLFFYNKDKIGIDINKIKNFKELSVILDDALINLTKNFDGLIYYQDYEWLICEPYDFNSLYSLYDNKPNMWCITYDNECFYRYMESDLRIIVCKNKLDNTKDFLITLKQNLDSVNIVNIVDWKNQEHNIQYFINMFNCNERPKLCNVINKICGYENIDILYIINNNSNYLDKNFLYPSILYDYLIENKKFVYDSNIFFTKVIYSNINNFKKIFNDEDLFEIFLRFLVSYDNNNILFQNFGLFNKSDIKKFISANIKELITDMSFINHVYNNFIKKLKYSELYNIIVSLSNTTELFEKITLLYFNYIGKPYKSGNYREFWENISQYYSREKYYYNILTNLSTDELIFLKLEIKK